MSVRRSAGVVRVKGQGATIIQGPTKTGKPRVTDLDAATVALLRSHRRERGTMALQLARDGALVFGDHEGRRATQLGDGAPHRQLHRQSSAPGRARPRKSRLPRPCRR